MVEAHLKQFSDSRNSFTCSCILLASFFFFFFLVDFLRIPIEAKEKILQTQIFSTGADGDIVYQFRSSWYVVVT